MPYLSFAFLDVDLVPKDDKREVFRVVWRCLYEKLVPPAVQCLERLGAVDVVHQHTAVCPPVVSYSKGLETLLTSRVPELPESMSIVDSFPPPTWIRTCMVTRRSSTITSFVRLREERHARS